MNTNYTQWHEHLKTVSQARQAGNPTYIHKASRRPGYYINSQANSCRRLAIPEIVDISQGAFGRIREDYVKKKITETEFSEMTTNIKVYTEELIQARVSKRDHPFRKMLRKMALALTTLLKKVGIEHPHNLILADNTNFQQEIDRLRKELSKSYKELKTQNSG